MNRILSFLICCLFTIAVQAQNLYFPPLSGDTWETISPGELDFCPERIDSLYNFLETQTTKSFILLKDGKIVLERYFGNFTQDSLWFWFSAGKSLMATLTGIAYEEGLLDINDPTSDYLGTGWTSMSPTLEQDIQIVHQLTMTTGLNPVDFECSDPECLTFFQEPGTYWVYHNAPYSLLRNVLESASGQNLNVYTQTRVGNKIGLNGFWLSSGYNNFFLSTAREMARFGLLIQNGGTWDGTPVLSDTTYFNQMVNSSQQLNPSYGYLWWLNGKSSYIPPGLPISFPGPIAPDAPNDVFTAAGSQGQYISISPSSGLIMVRQGTSNNDDLAALNLQNLIWAKILDLNCTTTSVTQTSDQAFQIFPNPAANHVRFDGLPDGDFVIRFFSMTGQLVNVINNTTQADLTDLKSGVYLVEITTDSGRYTEKLLIAK